MMKKEKELKPLPIAKNKKLALDKFVSELQARFGNKILEIHLFGSTAKGTATQESDIDVLVIYSDIEKDTITETIADITFRIGCELNESIEPILMEEQEYKEGIGKSPFLWEVLQFGKPLFITSSSTEWALDFKDYLSLAGEYLTCAKDASSENKIRLAIDAAYNAAELLVKALIISKHTSLASSHGGFVNQFGQLFVVTGELNSQLGRGLRIGLKLRADARYNPKAKLSKKDAEFVIELAEKLLNIAEEKLGK
ncbi:MAG: HEPN domain-containing protein [Candidatus Thermoplasmatota archaeon]